MHRRVILMNINAADVFIRGMVVLYDIRLNYFSSMVGKSRQ